MGRLMFREPERGKGGSYLIYNFIG